MAYMLILGNELVEKFSTEDEARNVGTLRHTSDKPAKIDFIPEGCGGDSFTLVYDPRILDWLPEE